MKQKCLWALAALLVVFSAIAFIPPFPLNEGFWVAYAFGVVAIGSQYFFFKNAFGGRTSAKSRFYGYPIARIGAIYLGAQVILSIAEMALSAYIEPWIFAIANLALLAFAALGLISTEIARKEVSRQDTATASHTATLRDMQVTARAIKRSCTDESLSEDLDRLVSALEFSDPVSSSQTRDIEGDIHRNLEDIALLAAEENLAKTDELIRSTLLLVEKRNDLCKMAKH